MRIQVFLWLVKDQNAADTHLRVAWNSIEPRPTMMYPR